jgi:toxin-antitoxin system PIN domain toxin
VVGLLDVNVLVALLVPVHEHHASARQWVLTTGARDGWATCPITELGLIRVCAQLPVGHRAPEATADTLVLFRTTNAGHVFWPDVVSPATLAQVRSAMTAKQVTDRYLWGLARHYGGSLVTFDRGLAAAGGDDAAFCHPAPEFSARFWGNCH